MASLDKSKAVSLEGGVLSFLGDGDYSFEFRKFAQIHQEGGQTTNLTDDQYNSITALDIQSAAHVTLAASDLISNPNPLTIANLEGTLDITGVDFTGADEGGFEPSTVTGLDSLIGSAIDAHDAGYVAARLTVDGSKAEAFQLLWDYLDDAYVAGNNYYDLDLNENFVRLGVEYVNYLEAGGDPLTDVMAKFTADGGDAGDNPDRAQSMHDNLLGNLWGPAVQDRFDGEQEADLLALIPDEYEARPWFSGNEAHLGNAAHDGARAFDYEKGWDRPDYIETTINGTVDERAQDGGEMLFGDGNSVDNWNIVRHEGAGVELALKAKERGGDDYIATEVDGVTHYAVHTGTDEGTTNRAAWNFDFAATSGISGQEELVDEFVFKLLIDVDKTEATNFFEVDPAAIPDNPASDYSEQNSWNFGFGFLRDLIDGDPNTDGHQAYDFGEGQFDFVLEAYDNGELIASNHIVVDVLLS